MEPLPPGSGSTISAMPCQIDMVASVTMIGGRPMPTTSTPLSRPAREPDRHRQREAEEPGCSVTLIAITAPATLATGPERQVDAARQDDQELAERDQRQRQGVDRRASAGRSR